MKNEEWTKISTFSELENGQKQMHGRLPLHAKMGPKEEYKGKYNMEVPNGVEPFFNVE